MNKISENSENQQTLDVLRRILTEVGAPQKIVKSLDWDTDLFEESLVDSVSLVAAAVKIERAFGISIPSGDFDPENFSTLRRIAGLIGGAAALNSGNAR